MGYIKNISVNNTLNGENYFTQVDTFLVNGNGTLIDFVSVDKSSLPSTFSLQVVGTGAAATAWTAELQGSLDGVNFTTILTHNTASGNGVVVFNGSNWFPTQFIRIKVSGLTLGPATNIKVYAVGVD